MNFFVKFGLMSLVASISLEFGNKEQKTFLLPAVEQLGEQTHQEVSETSQVTKKEHIKNVVLLVLENRSFDNLFGAFVNEEDPVDNLLDKGSYLESLISLISPL